MPINKHDRLRNERRVRQIVEWILSGHTTEDIIKQCTVSWSIGGRKAYNYLKKAKETLIRARETDLEKNEFWMNKIESVYYDNTDPATIMNFRDRVNAMTVNDLKEETAHYMKADHYLRVCLVPEKK